MVSRSLRAVSMMMGNRGLRRMISLLAVMPSSPGSMRSMSTRST